MQLINNIKNILSLRNPKKIIKSVAFNLFLVKPRRNLLFSKFLRIFTKISEPQKWIFVVGCYNSGTTLLIKLLETYSSKISVLNEGASKTDVLKVPEEFGWKRMWYKIVDKVKVKGDYAKAIMLKKDWSIFFNKSKQLFLEKSIVNILNMEWLQKFFPNSYFIAIVRNGYAVAEGIKRRSKFSGLIFGSIDYPIEMCTKQWIISNQIIEMTAEKLRNFKLIFYEDLCKNPRKIIDNIYKFLGISREFNFNNSKEWKILEKRAKIINMNNFSFKNLNQSKILKIENIAKEMLEYYNYEILSEKNNISKKNT